MITHFTKSARQFCCLTIISLLTMHSSRAQTVHVTSTTSPSYTVNVTFTPVSISIPTGSCYGPGNFNYNLSANYSVTFTGAGAPSLYTLQVYYKCGTTSSYFTLPVSGGSAANVLGSTSSYNGTVTCATATPSNLSCTNYDLVINGNGIASQTINVSGNQTTGSPLPIKLKSFDARAQAKSVYLTWTTSTETNNNEFILERSTDATNWNRIYSTSGAGNSSIEHVYQYTDEQPIAGINYYRIKNVANGGQIEISSVIGAKMGSGLTDITIYPNPARDNKIFVSGLETPTQWSLGITSATGQRLYKAAITDATIALPELSAGVYFLHLTNTLSNESKVIKYIKE